MSPILVFLIGCMFASLVMLAMYMVQRKTNDASIVDVAWTANLGALAVLYGMTLEGYALRQYLLMALAGFWSVRLTIHLLVDRIIGKEEDGRYQEIRRTYKGNIQFFFFWFFQLQALADIILSISFFIAAINPKPFLDIFDYLAIALALVSLIGEAIADFQLAQFRAKPENKGKTCRAGLWKYSRHPNYFFEWLHWLVYPLLAVGAPYWWLTLIAPVMMLYFILRVTGIPATEEQALKSRGDDYRRYQETTSMFVPWFPKKESP